MVIWSFRKEAFNLECSDRLTADSNARLRKLGIVMCRRAVPV